MQLCRAAKTTNLQANELASAGKPIDAVRAKEQKVKQAKPHESHVEGVGTHTSRPHAPHMERFTQNVERLTTLLSTTRHQALHQKGPPKETKSMFTT